MASNHLSKFGEWPPKSPEKFKQRDPRRCITGILIASMLICIHKVGESAMCSHMPSQFTTVWMLTSVGGRYKPINSVLTAAELLLCEWPSVDGKAYLSALQACLEALQGSGSIDAVSVALMRAADEAFVMYIRVVEDDKNQLSQAWGRRAV